MCVQRCEWEQQKAALLKQQYLSGSPRPGHSRGGHTDVSECLATDLCGLLLPFTLSINAKIQLSLVQVPPPNWASVAVLPLLHHPSRGQLVVGIRKGRELEPPTPLSFTRPSTCHITAGLSDCAIKLHLLLDLGSEVRVLPVASYLFPLSSSSSGTEPRAESWDGPTGHRTTCATQSPLFSYSLDRW